MPFDSSNTSGQPLLPGLLEGQPAPTFALLRAQIQKRTDLSATRKRDWISTLDSFGRILRQPLANIRADVATLNDSIFEHPPAAHRMAHSTFTPLVSRLRAILRDFGLHAPDERGEGRLGPAWQHFLDHISRAPLRAGLRRFARYCERQGRQPTDVSDRVLVAYLTEDRATRLAASTDEQGPNIAAAWIRAVRMQPDPKAFPGLTAPRRRVPYTFPFEDYPQSFQEEVARFKKAIARVEPQQGAGSGKARVVLSAPRKPGEGPFTPSAMGAFKRLKPRSVEARLFSIRQAAAALIRTGTPIEQITSLRTLVEPIDHPERIITYYLDRADGEPGSMCQSIAEVLHMIARYHVRVAPDGLAQIAQWKSEVTAERNGEMGPKARKCLRQLWQPRNRMILLNLPAVLLERAKSDQLSPVERARTIRNAVILEILIRCPLRISNLQGLRLDNHLARLDGPRWPSHILIQRHETKNDNAINFPIPADAARLIQRYIDEARPQLAEDGNPFLFPGSGQEPLSVNQVRQVFKDHVGGATGANAYPHVMRHFAGLMFLERRPGQYELLRRVLGHKDVETTKAFYTGLETDMAFEIHDKGVLSHRAAGRAMLRDQSKRPPAFSPVGRAGRR